MVGGALGTMVAPGIGTALGSQLGSAASNLFELELESMPQEEAEFEVAKRLVGLTAAAAATRRRLLRARTRGRSPATPSPRRRASTHRACTGR